MKPHQQRDPAVVRKEIKRANAELKKVIALMKDQLKQKQKEKWEDYWRKQDRLLDEIERILDEDNPKEQKK